MNIYITYIYNISFCEITTILRYRDIFFPLGRLKSVRLPERWYASTSYGVELYRDIYNININYIVSSLLIIALFVILA